MKCSFMIQPTNLHDWDRYIAADWDRAPDPTDWQRWSEILPLVQLIEDSGFDTFYSTEHHTTPYGIIPNPLLFMAWVAGHTKRIGVGTMVIVLPWYKDPLRVAEDIALLDNLLDGRELTVGFSRGAAPVEFKAMGVDQGEARERLVEGVQLIQRALREEHFSFEGQYFNASDVSCRPRLRNADVVDRMVATFRSVESAKEIAHLGLGMVNTVIKPFDEVTDDVLAFNVARAEVGLEPAQPTIVVYTYVTDTDDEIDEFLPYVQNYVQESTLHYGFDRAENFAGVKGYEYLSGEASDHHRRATTTMTREELLHGAPHRPAVIAGTPDQVIKRFEELQKATSAKEFIISSQVADMPMHLLEKSVRRFSEHVMPAIKAMPAAFHNNVIPKQLA